MKEEEHYRINLHITSNGKKSSKLGLYNLAYFDELKTMNISKIRLKVETQETQ